MPKKKKAIRKAKKKPTRSAKQSRAKIPARKKKSVKRPKEKARVIAVEIFEVKSMGDVEDDSSLGETGSGKEDELDEHFPPDYGGSE
ncbi:MAG TPA: hypothetical protein VK709_13920 [Candidatus Saccharimonadales bacterium]|jgi:hypothetical protein|nr:hypothetical protein [Candidatus Saccharimonadales bacterium]